MQALLFISTAMLLASGSLQAQIHTQPSVPGAQRPTLLHSANGVPQIDITTPSAAGISRNQFQQFDVQTPGVIINNGRTASSTQLGGWVAANPWLAGGSAAVILHEVQSTAPSLLNGPIEVAGNKAQFILANPAGIQCNGCAFIHIPQLQLVTGTPQLTAGQLSGFTLGSGSIDISGKGMDTTQVDLAELISRATRINAALWAKSVRITNAAHPGTPAATTDPVPFAVDISADARLVAGKIWLIGTADGLGVRNHGSITAMDGLILTADGRIENQGSIDAGQLQLQAATLNNSGSISAQDSLTIVTSAQLENRGTIASQHLHIRTPVLHNLDHGRLLGEQVAIDATQLHNLGQADASPVIAATRSLDIGTAELINADHALLFSGDTLRIGGALDANAQATGVARRIENRSATIDALGDMQIATEQFANTNLHFQTELAAVGAPEQRTLIAPKGSTEPVPITHFRWEAYSHAGRYRWKTDTSSSSDGTPGLTPLPGVDEEVCTGQTGHESCVPLASARYLSDDPAWSYFQLPIPDPAPIAPTAEARAADSSGTLQRSYDVAHDTWQSTTDSRRAALNSAIVLYNDGFAATHIIDWTQYEITRRIQQSRVTQSDPAQLSAGGQLHLSGGVFINDKSRLLVGGTLSVEGDRLRNIDATGQHIVTDTGTSQFTRSRWRGGFKNYYDRVWAPKLDYAPADVVSTIVLPVMEIKTDLGTPPAADHTALHSGTLTQLLHTSDPGKLNSLFRLNVGSGPLIETDPRFTEYRQWANAESQLRQLGADPASMQKRLGDGFVEQTLVREQIAALTGARFLDDYHNDDTQYAALLNNGVAVAQRWSLRPGIALSAEQVAQLTSDIVWLVQDTLTLPGQNGQPERVEQVLVPRLYLRPRSGDLQHDGTLIAANQIEAHLRDAIDNNGTLRAHQLVQLETGTLNNSGTLSGTTVLLRADQDINITGGRIQADDTLVLQAQRDINAVSSTQSSTRHRVLSQASRTGVDRVASLYVSGGEGALVLSSGRDINLDAASLTHAGTGETALVAGGELNLGVIATHDQHTSAALHDDANHLRQGQRTEIGTQIHTGGPLSLVAGSDLNIKAATLHSADGAITLQAGRDVHVVAGESGQTFDQGVRTHSSDLISTSTLTTRETLARTDAIESVISGATVRLQAGRDGQIVGSEMVSTNGTTLKAGQDLLITAVTDTQKRSSDRQQIDSGLMSGEGLSITLGQHSTDQTQSQTSTSTHGSLVGATNGSVQIDASGHYRQNASQVLAPAGTVGVHAADIGIAGGTNTAESTTGMQTKQTGLTLAISNPIIAGVQTLDKLNSAARKTKDGRAQAMAVTAAALTVANTAAAVAADPSHAGGVTVSLSVGTSQSNATSTQRTTTVAPSTVAAGDALALIAEGAGDQSSLHVEGSQIIAGTTVRLRAEGDLQLEAQANTSSLASHNHSSNASIGVTARFGPKPGVGVTLAGSRGHGQADGNDLSWINTEVEAGQSVTLASQGHTVLRGAIVRAGQVNATVGGNLRIESRQDSSNYTSQQRSIGGSLTVGPSPSANLNLAKQDVESTYLSVTETSGIRAGDGGFQVQVGGQTDLKGGVISSSEQAVQADRNQFNTRTLKTSDLVNQADYKASATGVSVGAGVSQSGALAPAGTSIGVGGDSGSEHSVTSAGISEVAGDKTVRTGDAPTGVAKIFDAARVEQDVGAQVFIMQTFTREAPRAIARYADTQVQDLLKQAASETDLDKQALLRSEAAHWAEGGTYRVALHAATGAMAGGLEGALGAGTVAAAAPLLNDWQRSLTANLQAAGVKASVAQATASLITGTAAAGIGAVVSGGSVVGAAAGVNVDANNRQLHISTYERIRDGCRGKSSTECQTINRIGGTTSGMPTDDPKIVASQVVANYDASGKVVSFTLIERNTNQPTMIMEPLEFAAYRNATPGIQAMMRMSPQYALDFASAGLYSAAGDNSRAVEHVVAGVTSRDYVRDVGLGVAGAAMSAVVGARPAAPAVVTSEGTANAATNQLLKNQLVSENLANIAAQDPRLANAMKGSGTTNPNFSLGAGTVDEASRLGQIWVGDGAKPMNGVLGGLVSADGTRVYRPPTYKPDAPAEFNPTGTQANFVMQKIDSVTGKATIVSNGHLVVKP